MSAYTLRDDPLEHLPDADLRRRVEAQPVAVMRLALELARRESKMVPVTIASPADLGRLLFPTATPLDGGVYVVLLTSELRVVGMERLDGVTTPEVVVQVALEQGTTVIAVVRTVAGGELVGGAWERALLAETRVLDVLLVAGVRWRSVREWQGGR